MINDDCRLDWLKIEVPVGFFVPKNRQQDIHIKFTIKTHKILYNEFYCSLDNSSDK